MKLIIKIGIQNSKSVEWQGKAKSEESTSTGPGLPVYSGEVAAQYEDPIDES
jgi:hypothetical protein